MSSQDIKKVDAYHFIVDGNKYFQDDFYVAGGDLADTLVYFMHDNQFGHYQDKLNILDGYRFELSKINPQFGNELRFLRNARAALGDILHDDYFQNVIFDTETTTLWDKLSDRFEGCVAGFLRNNVPHDMLADMLMAVTAPENGRWECIPAGEHNLMKREDWAQADKEEALTYI